MIFNWKKLNDVGNHLKDYSTTEEYQRSAIGRYYYGCYHIFKQYFEKKIFSLRLSR